MVPLIVSILKKNATDLYTINGVKTTNSGLVSDKWDSNNAVFMRVYCFHWHNSYPEGRRFESGPRDKQKSQLRRALFALWGCWRFPRLVDKSAPCGV
jgi:hypothetical protein